MLFSEQNAIIPLIDAGYSISVAAGTELNSFNMTNYAHAAIILSFATTWACGSAMTILIESGSADSADISQDATFTYRWNTGSIVSASTSMIYGVPATASVLTVSAEIAGNTVIMEIDGDDLYTATTGEVYEWLTVQMDNATTGQIAAYAILSNPRYAGASMPVAI